ncbi:uncharacterized protein A4U43_C03F11610 [Asparagus officinalis]|uniref:Uncharacterized protein n=1 Tax=Asparagus officinalis TaxID=4686 RepID=A0A5P1FA12_ASPOF|nr:uncharacterized protein A4U43_C03F11610 [Asparagus officinalis]
MRLKRRIFMIARGNKAAVFRKICRRGPAKSTRSIPRVWALKGRDDEDVVDGVVCGGDTVDEAQGEEMTRRGRSIGCRKLVGFRPVSTPSVIPEEKKRGSEERGGLKQLQFRPANGQPIPTNTFDSCPLARASFNARVIPAS